MVRMLLISRRLDRCSQALNKIHHHRRSRAPNAVLTELKNRGAAHAPQLFTAFCAALERVQKQLERRFKNGGDFRLLRGWADISAQNPDHGRHNKI